MDYVKTRRYKIIKTKPVMICATNLATDVGTARGPGQVSAKPEELRQTPASKIVSMRIPGSAFGPGWKVVVLLKAEPMPSSLSIVFISRRIIVLSRSTRRQATAGGINAYTRRMYFKDA
jgi:hypothetical protein